MDNNPGVNISLGEADLALQKSILNAEEKILAMAILEAGISTLFVLLGIIGNVLSTIVFYRMGYQDTINISMTFICVADTVRCFFIVLFNLYYPFQLISPVFSARWSGISKVTCYYLALVVGYVSSVLAAYISLERCLCVSIPFTVKYLLTPRVVWINNTIITLTVLGTMLFLYISYTFVWVFSPELNATIAVEGFTKFHFDNPGMNVYVTFIGVAWLFLSFVLICICTGIIFCHLRNASKFKSSATQKDGQSAGLSTRDRQVMKMLLVIVVVYIAVNLPRMLFFIGRIAYPGFDLYGTEHDFFSMSYALVSTVDYINPAVNFLIFYFMSSQFHKSFQTIFCCSSKKETK